MSTKSIKHQFNQISKLDTSREPIDLLKKKYQALTNGTWTEWYGGPFSEIWRARLGIHDSIQLLWYPPSKAITHLGRLNRRNDPLFYACFGHNPKLGSIEEIKAKRGDFVTQIACKLVPEAATLKIIGLGHIHAWLKSKAPTHLQGEFGRNQQDRMLKFDSIKDFKKNEAIKDELDHMFKMQVPPNKSHLYAHSIAIAENVFENIEGAQGILFPSIAAQEKAVNLVLLPHVVDQYYEVFYARVVEILSKNHDEMEFRLVAESSTFGADGTIHWDFKSDRLKQEVIHA